MDGLFSLLDRLEDELSLGVDVASQLFPSWKIVGGSKATPGMFPFVASLKIKKLNK